VVGGCLGPPSAAIGRHRERKGVRPPSAAIGGEVKSGRGEWPFARTSEKLCINITIHYSLFALHSSLFPTPMAALHPLSSSPYTDGGPTPMAALHRWRPYPPDLMFSQALIGHSVCIRS